MRHAWLPVFTVPMDASPPVIPTLTMMCLVLVRIGTPRSLCDGSIRSVPSSMSMSMALCVSIVLWQRTWTGIEILQNTALVIFVQH